MQVLLPSAAIGVIFWLVMHWILAADRSERKALAAEELEQKSKGAPAGKQGQKIEGRLRKIRSTD